MPRPVRFVVLIMVVTALASLLRLTDQTVDAQEQPPAQLQLTLQLAPMPESASFAGGLVDMRFSGAERDWNAGTGLVDLGLVNESEPNLPVSVLGSLSWSTGDTELPVPPTNVTFSLFAASGEPYRVMLSVTPDTLFTVLSESADEVAMVVHGTIHLHISTGSVLAIDELVRVRGNAVYSETGEPR